MTINGASDFDDLDSLRANPETTSKAAERSQKSRETYTVVPDEFLQQVATRTKLRASLLVALHMLKLDWKNKGEAFQLTNIGLEKLGISRQEKWKALGELEAQNLIRVEHICRKSPRVTLLR